MSLIETLTPEQEALIPVYRDKWKQIALSTERIDRQKATEAVKSAYAAINLSEPKILFFDSPFGASKTFISLFKLEYSPPRKRGGVNFLLWLLGFRHEYFSVDRASGRQLSPEELLEFEIRDRRSQLWEQLYNQPVSQLWEQIDNLLEAEQVWELSSSLLMPHLMSPESQLSLGWIKPEYWAESSSLFDFCISVLNCTYNPRQWAAYQLLVENCGWLFSFEKTCIVCDRPIKFSFDEQNFLHTPGEPAVQFADGYSLYLYHGMAFPEKYGKLHPKDWRAQWLLKENNAELRRILIQEIGYARICQELQAQKLDYWQEYTLLKIDNDVDIEPIYLLKMTCPSTEFIHVLRVPPDMKSAREAVRWVNWGIAPEEFQEQT